MLSSLEGNETDNNVCLQVCLVMGGACVWRRVLSECDLAVLLSRLPGISTATASPPLAQDYVTEIRNDQCKALVKQYQVLAAQDIRFDVPLADACFEDRTKLCANVPPVGA